VRRGRRGGGQGGEHEDPLLRLVRPVENTAAPACPIVAFTLARYSANPEKFVRDKIDIDAAAHLTPGTWVSRTVRPSDCDFLSDSRRPSREIREGGLQLRGPLCLSPAASNHRAFASTR
jgi:hypothetical protein